MTSGLSIDHFYRRMPRAFAVALSGGTGLWLAACAPQAPASEARIGNATAATVSASQATLAAAGRVILACYAVPACSAVAPKPTIKAAYDAAYTAVTQAQTIVEGGGAPDLTATMAAIDVLQGLVAKLPDPKRS